SHLFVTVMYIICIERGTLRLARWTLAVRKQLSTLDRQRSTFKTGSLCGEIDIVDFNHIFLFLALATPLLVLAKAWRPGGIFRGWRISAIIVLAITGLCWVFFREYAGYVGGGAWFVLLFLPILGLRRASQLARSE